MKSKLLQEEPQRTFAVVFDSGEEVNFGLLAFAREHDLAGSHFTAIGAFSEATLGFFDMASKEYLENRVEEQVEVLSLIGNFALLDGKEHKLHAHVVLGDRQGRALGGHLLSARVRPTLEVIVTEEPAHVQRKVDQATGLPLIALEEEHQEHRGVGQGMYSSISPPADRSDWKECPDCKVWVHGLNRETCPQCGHVFT